MADAWSTYVVRDSDWDDYTRSRVMAMQVWESGQCGRCGNYDCLVSLETDRRHVTWADHDGRVFEVAQYRCLACGAADLIKRDWHNDHEKDKPTKGTYMPADGRMFIPRPAPEED